MKRFVALALLMVTVFTAVTPFAMASQRSTDVEVIECPSCGGICIFREIMDGQNGSCKEGTHYNYAEGYVCTSCGFDNLVHGHYCTGNGGHFCLGGCNCK